MLIREAKTSDSREIFAWRNDLLSSSMSISNSKIDFKEHEKWYQGSLKDSKKKLYIGMIAEEKIGICRFDFNASENCAEVSINLNPEMRGKGLASKLLFYSMKKYREGNLLQLKATIKKENIASIKIFKKCDFVQVDENDICFFLKNRG
jgi:RimJ/RimL family protein N-acetyltransferase